MIKWSKSLAMLFVGVTFFCSQVGAFPLAVDENVVYQKIDGFGAFNRADAWTVKNGPFFTKILPENVGYYDSIVADAGYTLMRCDPVLAFQATKGNFDLSPVRNDLMQQKKYLDAAKKLNEDIKFLWCCWSPPGWMKANGQVNGTTDGKNYLMPEHFVDYANHWIKLITLSRDTFGVVPYAISLQNEPLFDEPYASCNYTAGPGCGWNGVCYNNMFRVVAPLIHKAFPDIKIVASEDLNRTTIETVLRADAISNTNIYAWATHNDNASSFAYNKDRPIWNTEPHANSFMGSAQMIMSNLISGASAYTEWGRVDDCESNPTTDAKCIKAGTYRGMKMFSRYVRPGAVRVSATGNGNNAIAFYHKQDTCLSIIMINSGSTVQTATLNITGSYVPSQFTAYVSTATLDESNAGTVANNGTISLPAGSVVTLVAGKYKATVTTSVMNPSKVVSNLQSRKDETVKLYNLSGKLIAQLKAQEMTDATFATVVSQMNLASGTYFCSQKVNGKKFIMVPAR